MRPLDAKHWQHLNRIILEIHSIGSRNELHELVGRSLPPALGAEQAGWCEHGTMAASDRACSSSCFHHAVLNLMLETSASKHSKPAPKISDHGVFDLATLISNSRRKKSAIGKIVPHTRSKHHLVTQFFIDARSGVLLTVRNSRPFTDEQKFSLSLLREHLAIAARRHYRSDSIAGSAHPMRSDIVLSRREKEVLPCLVKGMTNPEIATTLGISPRTVEKHVASILDKSGLDNRRMLIGLNGSSILHPSPSING